MIAFSLSSCSEAMQTNPSSQPPQEFGYYIRTAEFPSFFKQKKASIFFVEKWGTPEFHNLEGKPVWTGISHDQKIFWGCEEEEKFVYFISEHITEFGDTIYLEKFFYKDAVTRDPRTTSCWINILISLIEDDSIGDDGVNLDDFIMRSTYSEGEKDGEFASYRQDLKRKIMAEEGKTAKEKLVIYTSRMIPGSPENWGKRAWFYAEWNQLDLKPLF